MPPGDAPPAAVQEPHDARQARERFDLLLSQLSAEFSAAQLGGHLQPASRGSASLGRAGGETGLPVSSTGLANTSEPPSIQVEQQPSADVVWDAPSPVADRELLTPLAKVNVGRRREDEIERSQAEVNESPQAVVRRGQRKPKRGLARAMSSTSSYSKASRASRAENNGVAGPLKTLMRRLGRVSAKAIKEEALRHIDSIEVESRPRHIVQELLNSSWFDTAMGFVIFANSIQIGMESSYRLNGIEVPAFVVLEWVFLLTYIVELGLRFFAFGRRCFSSGWVQFDALLVAVSVAGAVAEPAMGDLGPLMVLRAFRLFRLARAVRLLVQFKTLWLLLQGLLSSGTTVVYTFGLLIIILYIFSCIAMEMITIPWSTTPADENPAVKKLVDEFWPNLSTAMLTLVQFVFFDSVASIYTPMIMHDYKLLIFFLPFLMIVSIALMNLVTAVLVEGSLAQAGTDKEEQIHVMLPVLKQAFYLMDVNQSGTVNRQEVEAVNKEGYAHLQKYLGGDSLLELFEMFDADESGEVDIESFCAGITRLAESGKPMEFFRILHKINDMEETLEEFTEMLSEILAASPFPAAAPSPAGVRMSPAGADMGTTQPESNLGNGDGGDDADLVRCRV